MKEPYQIRKFRKGDVYVDAFLGQSKTEVIDTNDIAVLKNTWFDPCKMDWVSDTVNVDIVRSKDPRKDTYFIITHQKVLVESNDEENGLLAKTNEMIKDYKENIGNKNRCTGE